MHKLSNKKYTLGLLGFAILGFLDATYLAIEHFLGVIPPCSVVSGCEEVLTSSFSTIGSVPVALLGALYYLAIIILTIIFLDTDDTRVLRTAAQATTLGFIASVIFVYIQLFVLHAICVYCMGSAVSSSILFVIGMHFLFSVEKTNHDIDKVV